jgi:hypothetical protein
MGLATMVQINQLEIEVIVARAMLRDKGLSADQWISQKM